MASFSNKKSNIMRANNFNGKSNLSIFLAMLVLCFSCTQYETLDSSNEELSVEMLRSIHNDIEHKFESGGTFGFKSSLNDQVQEIFNFEFDKNLEIAQNKGLEFLFDSNGIDTSLPNTIDWAINNLSNENFYEDLLEVEEVESIETAELIFTYLHTFIEYSEITNSSKSALNLVARGACGRAVVGTILATAIFAGVTAATGGFGTAAAVGFLITKGWSTYNVIAACKK